MYKKVLHTPTVTNPLLIISETDLTLPGFVSWHKLKIFKGVNFMNFGMLVMILGLWKVNYYV